MRNLTPSKDQGRFNLEWLRDLRRRTKISFSRDRFDDKLRELEARIGSLSTIRKHIDLITSTAIVSKSTSQERVIGFRDVHKAASGLHEVLSSLWRCNRRGLHYACICVDIEDDKPFHHPQNIRFDLAWTCPSKRKLPDHVEKPLRLSVEAIADPQAGKAGPLQFLEHQGKLQTSLEAATSSSTKRKPPLHSDPHLSAGTVVFGSLPNLSSMPNLCGHLRPHPCGTANPHGVGFFETSMTSRHFIYSQCDSKAQTKTPKTLEDALKASKSLADGIPLPEKLNIAKLLALAVLQYHSTP